MSNHWRIACAQCDDFVGHVNYGERQLLAVMRHRAALEAFGAAQNAGLELQIEPGNGGEGWGLMPRFFAQHAGHELRVRDEYGHFSGTCPEYFRCPMCNASHACGLPPEHDGKCGFAK